MDNRPIGVFDSGIGGVSALRDMARVLPRERFIYYGDDANAPYGTRPQEDILRLSLADAEFLLKRDVKAIVIACNTATSAAASALRERLSIPVIGMEPALKPASMMREEGEIAVLATPATLKLDKFQHLMSLYGQHAVPVSCPGLVEFVERGETAAPALDAFLQETFAPLRAMRLDAAVLGCTHYVFLASAIARALPGVPLVDGNAGTARQLKRVLARNDALCASGAGGVEMHTSGDANRLLPLMRALFETPIEETAENR